MCWNLIPGAFPPLQRSHWNNIWVRPLIQSSSYANCPCLKAARWVSALLPTSIYSCNMSRIRRSALHSLLASTGSGRGQRLLGAMQRGWHCLRRHQEQEIRTRHRCQDPDEEGHAVLHSTQHSEFGTIPCTFRGSCTICS